MAETKIEWCDYTFNSWTGCTKVSPACDHCYAESWAKRSGIVKWGNHPRRRTSESYWQQPLKWNRRAEKEGVRRKVFCCSLADVFDNQVDVGWRQDLYRLIYNTPGLDWLLLTKRPQNVMPMLGGCTFPDNVWLGTTAEDEAHYRQRWAHIAAVPVAVRFLSYEPALGPIGDLDLGRLGAPNWVICGGESGPHARPMHPDWARSVRDQCTRAKVPFFMKQWGEYGGIDETRKSQPMVMADDGTVYRPWDIAWPDGPRYGDAIRANHDKAHLTMIYRIGKKRAGAELDGRLWRQFPDAIRRVDAWFAAFRGTGG